MAYTNAQWNLSIYLSIAILNSPKECSMEYTNPPWPKRTLNGLKEALVAYRDPEGPRGILNGLRESSMA